MGHPKKRQVQPITVLKSDFKLAHHRQLAANGSYIVYGLRAGQLRCINKATAGRALYKGHAAPVADAAFFSPESNLLASVSTAGDLCVRLVVEVEGAPLAAPVTRAALAPPPAGGTARLAWHPTEPRILAAASGGAVGMFMVPSEAAAAPSEAADPSGLEPSDPSWEFALQAGRAATALAFSPGGDLLAAGDDAGGVSAWVLETSAGEAGSAAAVVQWAANSGGGGAVATACFLAQAGPGAPALLVTGDATNRCLRLWRLPGVADLAAGAAAELLQSFELASAAGAADFYCHAGLSPRPQLLILANTQRKQVHALHYSLTAADSSGGGAAASAEIDYVATFSVKQPIISMAVGYEVSESEANPGQMKAHVQLYCIQPDAVQQYTLDPILCTPPDAPRPTGLSGAGAAAASSVEEEGEAEVASAAAAAADADADDGGSADTATAVPPAVLPSPMRLLHKDTAATASSGASGKEAVAAAAAPSREPSPPPLPTTLVQQAKQQPAKEPSPEPEPAAAAAEKAHERPEEPAAQQQPKQKKQKQHTPAAAAASAAPPSGLSSLSPPASMPPLPTTLAAKAHGDKGAMSREASSSLGVPDVKPAVAPTVAVTPLPPSGGGAGGGSDDLEEGEIAPSALAAEEVAALRRQLERLTAGQAATAAALRAEVEEGMRAGEAAISARVEAAVARALAKRGEEEKKRAREAEKALATQISQVGEGGPWTHGHITHWCTHFTRILAHTHNPATTHSNAPHNPPRPTPPSWPT
jgi:hypothetical protein